MLKEIITTGASVRLAIDDGLRELGCLESDCTITIIEEPKKSLFGKIKGEAKVQLVLNVLEVTNNIANKDNENNADNVACNNEKVSIALAYLKEIIGAIGVTDVEYLVTQNDENATINFDGDGVAVLIGHHGDTLDALQYLVSLVANRIDSEYYRITLDCANYRQKREETLVGLANRIAAKVKASGKSQLLEPMNPYERRIIHSVISDTPGVFSKSKGEDPNRRVLILSENPSFSRPKNNTVSDKPVTPPTPKKKELTMEEILKNDKKDKDDEPRLYAKIEF